MAARNTLFQPTCALADPPIFTSIKSTNWPLPSTSINYWFLPPPTEMPKEILSPGKTPTDPSLRAFLALSPTPREASRSEEHTSDLQSLMRISYAVFCLNKQTNTTIKHTHSR